MKPLERVGQVDDFSVCVHYSYLPKNIYWKVGVAWGRGQANKAMFMVLIFALKTDKNYYVLYHFHASGI